MRLKSFNIFGVTGGIGNSFFNEIRDKGVDICGFYHNNKQVILQSNLSEKISLKKIDLSITSEIEETEIPNYEGLLYSVGKSHFGKGLFNFQERELQMHMNMNINSLFMIIQKLCSYEKISLKRVVVVSSIYPIGIESMYHAVKKMQNEFLKILKYSLNNKHIGLSAIKAGWVKTGMYDEYVKIMGENLEEVIEPIVVAKSCFQEFESEDLYNEITIATKSEK